MRLEGDAVKHPGVCQSGMLLLIDSQILFIHLLFSSPFSQYVGTHEHIEEKDMQEQTSKLVRRARLTPRRTVLYPACNRLQTHRDGPEKLPKIMFLVEVKD